MPNICTAFYVIEGEKKELDALYETMTSLQVMEQPLVENDFGPTWLGCLVKAFRLMTEEKEQLQVKIIKGLQTGETVVTVTRGE